MPSKPKLGKALPRYPMEDASAEACRAMTLGAMFKAKLRPDLIYVYDRTELMVGREGYQAMPAASRREYDRAFRAWNAISEAERLTIIEELRTWTRSHLPTEDAPPPMTH